MMQVNDRMRDISVNVSEVQTKDSSETNILSNLNA